MEVEKTVSPNLDSVEPNEVPVKDSPVLRWRVAGSLGFQSTYEPPCPAGFFPGAGAEVEDADDAAEGAWDCRDLSSGVSEDEEEENEGKKDEMVA